MKSIPLVLLLALPFSYPAPQGWKEETIPFPLSFAPKLEYQGVEVLRFAPGMFKKGAEDFWTYGFVWSLEGKVPLSAGRLDSNLKTYFEGLGSEVEKDRPGREIRITPHLAAVAPDRFEGRIEGYDPFVTHAPLALNIRVRTVRCEAQGRTAILFQISPQPFRHPVWQRLANLDQSFGCTKG